MLNQDVVRFSGNLPETNGVVLPYVYYTVGDKFVYVNTDYSDKANHIKVSVDWVKEGEPDDTRHSILELIPERLSDEAKELIKDLNSEREYNLDELDLDKRMFALDSCLMAISKSKKLFDAKTGKYEYQ